MLGGKHHRVAHGPHNCLIGNVWGAVVAVLKQVELRTLGGVLSQKDGSLSSTELHPLDAE